MIELLFQLAQDEEGWPPVAVEGLWCQSVGDRHRVETCPLFVTGISLGDEIEIDQDEQGQVVSFTVARPSGNSTVWLLFWDRDIVEATLVALRSLGCNTVGPLDGFATPHCAVDVPDNLDIAKVDAILRPLADEERIALAYPSFRHGGSAASDSGEAARLCGFEGLSRTYGTETIS